MRFDENTRRKKILFKDKRSRKPWNHFVYTKKQTIFTFHIFYHKDSKLFLECRNYTIKLLKYYSFLHVSIKMIIIWMNEISGIKMFTIKSFNLIDDYVTGGKYNICVNKVKNKSLRLSISCFIFCQIDNFIFILCNCVYVYK